jgi:hypothetical protein
MWAQILWTDKASFTTGGFGKVYITQQPEEKYLSSYYFSKFRSYSA